MEKPFHEPKLAFYLDAKQTKPLENIDFGEVDLDEQKTLEIFVLNYGERDLRKMTISTNNETVKVLECPFELPVGIMGKIKLNWQPKDKDLKAKLVIKGKFSK